MIFYLDTESIGLFGPTVLIQWALDGGPINVHNVFKEPVYKTLRLIELMCDHTVVGYNLSHDSYHINRTYGVLKCLPASAVPTPLDIFDYEKDDAAHDDFCVKPKQCIDYLVVGKKGVFQSVLKQKDILLRRVPSVLAVAIVTYLKRTVKIPEIYFRGNKTVRGANWRVIPLKVLGDGSTHECTPEDLSKYEKGNNPNLEFDRDFVNIRLSFNPSAALKNVIEHITGKQCPTLEDLHPLKRPEEYEYFPTLGSWLDVAEEHIWGWNNDPERVKYARDDVEYLRILRDYFHSNGFDMDKVDTDSQLAWACGACYWRGFRVDLVKVAAMLDTVNQEMVKGQVKLNLEGTPGGIPVSYNSPRQVLTYLHEACSPLERQAINDTKNDTLKNLIQDKDWQEGNPQAVERAENILSLRHLDKERDLYGKLIAAKRLYVQFKVIGTKSNRMSGGSESFINSRGSINPQGIKKSPNVRSCFLLAHSDHELSGGDFDGFEVSIAEAEYNDPELRKDLLLGKKIHGLFAEAMYNLPYAEIVKHKDLGENEPLGHYARGKRGFFGRLYGAQITKLMNVLWLDEEQINEGLNRFFARYKGVKESQDRVYADHQALVQEGGIGTQIIWKEPKRYVESFLGFKRHFDLEYNVCKSLFDLAQQLPDDIVKLGKGLRLIRRDRVQTGSGAAQSSIYAAAFNIQSQIMRSAVNHKIQSPGGQITKELQYRIWSKCQPHGCNKWHVMLFNVHDEIMIPHLKELREVIKNIVTLFLEEMKQYVPLISMEWRTGFINWALKDASCKNCKHMCNKPVKWCNDYVPKENV